MTELKTLLTALQAGDYDAVLKGTAYESCFIADTSIAPDPDGQPYVYDQGERNTLKHAAFNAARAHVLTLLVREMADLLQRWQGVAMRGHVKDIDGISYSEMPFYTETADTLALTAMLKQEGV